MRPRSWTVKALALTAMCVRTSENPAAFPQGEGVADGDADRGHAVHDARPGMWPSLGQGDESAGREVVRLPTRRQLNGPAVRQELVRRADAQLALRDAQPCRDLRRIMYVGGWGTLDPWTAAEVALRVTVRTATIQADGYLTTLLLRVPTGSSLAEFLPHQSPGHSSHGLARIHSPATWCQPECSTTNPRVRRQSRNSPYSALRRLLSGKRSAPARPPADAGRVIDPAHQLRRASSGHHARRDRGSPPRCSRRPPLRLRALPMRSTRAVNPQLASCGYLGLARVPTGANG